MQDTRIKDVIKQVYRYTREAETYQQLYRHMYVFLFCFFVFFFVCLLQLKFCMRIPANFHRKKTEGEIKNGQCRDTSTTLDTLHRMWTNTTKLTKTKKVSNMDSTSNIRGWTLVLEKDKQFQFQIEPFCFLKPPETVVLQLWLFLMLSRQQMETRDL